MFETTYFVLSPSYHGATLLAKLLNAHPELTALGDTYPSNAFDQVCGCGEYVSACPFWQGIKKDTDAARHGERTRNMLAEMDPMTVAELRPYFDQEWHFMGNKQLFDFDGTVFSIHHKVSAVRSRIINTICSGIL